MHSRYLILVMALSAALLSGCHHHDHSVEEEHHHSFILTQYSQNWELFVEAEPMVAGEHSHIIAHVTNLLDFKPFSDKHLKARLEVGGTAMEEIANPSSPGIYNLEFHPTVAGEGTLSFVLASEEYSDCPDKVFSFKVTVFADDHTAHHAVEDAEISNSNAIAFTKEQSWKIDFSTEECGNGGMGQVIRTLAQVLPSHSDEREVASPVSGVVTFASDAIVEGKQVGAGQLLFTVDNSALKDEANIDVMASQAESEYNYAKSEYERKAALAQEQIVSQADLTAARRDYEAAKARYNNLRRNYSGGKQKVSSPISGYVTSMEVKSGGFVQTGQSVMTISKSGSLCLKADIQPKYYNALRNFSSANIKLPDGQIITLDEAGGKMLSFGKSIDTSSPLVPVTFQIGRRDDLLPGTFVEMFIKTKAEAGGITVPEEGVVEEMGNYFVFVQLTPELFEKRAVKIGGTDGKRREILSGLSAGERVVGKGAVMVKLSQAAGTLDAHSGHVH